MGHEGIHEWATRTRRNCGNGTKKDEDSDSDYDKGIEMQRKPHTLNCIFNCCGPKEFSGKGVAGGVKGHKG